MKVISNIRPLLDASQGHNYALPDCIKFILEHLGAGDGLDYWDIAAITGDSVAQVYNHYLTTGCEYCVSGYLAGPEHLQYVFHTLGYDFEYITANRFNADKDRYLPKIVEMIDRDIPVLVKTNVNDIPEWHSDVGTYCLIVGYDRGQLYSRHEGPRVKLLFEGTVSADHLLTDEDKIDFVFIGEKQREVSLGEIYINAIKKMVYWLSLPNHDGLFYGAAAFRAWADDIEAGRFTDSDLSIWENYGVYVCNLATSPAIPFYLLKKLSEMDSVYSNYAALHDEIKSLFPSFKPDDVTAHENKDGLWSELESLGAGMNMELVKTTMQDHDKRSKVAAVLRDYAGRLDKTAELLKQIDVDI